MSLATLARKTRTKQRLRTRGKFILNMTGRGNVLGMSAKMSRGCNGFTKCAGKRVSCCAGVGEPDCCSFPHGGKPSKQMGYGVYLNRKSKGAYHPGGGPQCCTKPNATSGKIVWKQHSNLDASVVITNKKDNVLACNSDVYTAKRDTCTGCPVGANGSLTVGQSDVTGIVYGFADSDSVHLGAFVPPIINGNTVIELLWDEDNEEFVLGAVGILGETMFSSISFVNCEEKTVRTYYQGGHDGNAAAFTTSTTPQQSSWGWNAAASGFTAVNELAYWQGAVNSTLQVYIDNPNPPLTCPQCCCPVKKNICGCRATDLLRYTRINKSFGCQTTKAVRMGRTASEQIARNRAKVDCIKPKHKTIYIKLTGNDDAQSFEFDGCCGNQCLIPGQQYTFHITNSVVVTDVEYNVPIYILWCDVIGGVSALAPGQYDIFYINPGVNSKSFTVPKFNTSSKCVSSRAMIVLPGTDGDTSLTLDYCKQAFKRPQMLGSCSGR
jgi:hypothetical protein